MTALATVTADLPVPPRLGRALRDAASDFYYNSWRFAPANALWTMGLVGVLVLSGAFAPALLLAPLLALPGVGLARLAALSVRGESVAFSDMGRGIRERWRPALAVGVGAPILGVVFGSNALIGLQAAGVVGWLFAALSLYALIGLLMGLVTLWPLLGDPRRADWSLGRLLRLAGLANLARPGRMAGTTLLLVAFLALSTLLFAALATVSVAYAALVTGHYVLPLADRLDGVARTGRASAG